MARTSSLQRVREPEGAPRPLRRFSRGVTFAAIWTYALVVVDGISRITGSGLGCGDHWPKCNGRWIPVLTPEAVVEFAHRLLGAGIGIILLGVFVYAFRHRNSPGFRSRGMLRYAALLLTLIMLQSLVGLTIIWFEVPPIVVVIHFMNALAIMGILLVAAVRTRAALSAGAARKSAAGNAALVLNHTRIAHIAAILGFIAVVLGSLVANNIGAPEGCRGFPLCNGSLVPSGGLLVQLHWIHRVAAFATFLYVLYYGRKTWSSCLPSRVRAVALAAVIMVTLQLVVAAGLALLRLPLEMRILHLAVGTALWGTLVMWASTAKGIV